MLLVSTFLAQKLYYIINNLIHHWQVLPFGRYYVSFFKLLLFATVWQKCPSKHKQSMTSGLTGLILNVAFYLNLYKLFIQFTLLIYIAPLTSKTVSRC